MLRYGVIDGKGFLLLVGDVGTGKTTLINALLQTLGNDTIFANLTDPELDLIDFFNYIAKLFNISKEFDNKTDFLVCFKSFLLEAHEKNKNVLLIIDEAHKLSTKILEQIRLLSNLELPGKKLINIFLVGQNELNDVLASRECRALRQRIPLTFQISPLSENETAEYVQHRLRVAGSEAEIFSRKAIHEIYRYSRGYPRLINIICDYALLTGYVKEQKIITPAIIKECSQELNLPGQTKESSLGDFPEQSVAATTAALIDPACAGETDIDMESEVEEEAPVTSLKPKVHIEGGKILAAETTENLDNYSNEIIAWLKRQRIWYGAFVATFVVIVVIAYALLSHEASSIRSGQHIAAGPVLTTPPPFPDKTGSNFDQHPPTPSEEVDAVKKTAAPKIETLELAKEALSKGDFIRAADLFEDGIEERLADMPQVAAFYAEALRGQAGLLLATESEKAEILLCKAVELDPQSAKIHFDLGKRYTELKEYAKAIKAYQKAADLNNRFAGSFYNLGYIYAMTKDYENAEKMFLRVAELNPLYLDRALFNLAMVQQKQDKQGQCIKNLEKALHVNPSNERARKYFNLYKGDPGKS